MTWNLTMCPDGNTDPDHLSPLTLAFVGDTVFDLLVRQRLVVEANRPVGKLHTLSADLVCARAQALAAEKLAGLLRDEETAVYKRGRNARSSHNPKSATSAEYHAATGLEALFGWLYLKGDIQRVKELFEALCEK